MPSLDTPKRDAGATEAAEFAVPSHTPLTAYATLKQARKTFHHHPPQIARRADRGRRTPPARNQASSGGKTRFQSPILILSAGGWDGPRSRAGPPTQVAQSFHDLYAGNRVQNHGCCPLRLIGGRYDLDELSKLARGVSITELKQPACRHPWPTSLTLLVWIQQDLAAGKEVTIVSMYCSRSPGALFSCRSMPPH